ncbi:hypothetical protein R70723_19760 [Paenibacillus sp. FSL R7-0273]|uniref:DUF4097 family beta strand repeat-containing protein n=1 Tax=Paenibacillus sp. FSL R7-0273 TaxID=1536772 RepID=UPI0004F85AF4|nr:DUF4097 family beta strand repeat-containing protein [Paenibacillus sp. FSL R7-0273]AIQ47888.1 hypothetical protein R70723_19760 [Paenibacillus sp. FSL R7-0273]OMF94559.1 hypothetical protein BK144_08535 [Paenibacillus sp. FSL R7-0273]
MRKKHNTAIVAAVAVFSLILLAGCGDLPGKEAADRQLEESLTGSNGSGFIESISLDIGEAAEDISKGITEATEVVQEAVKETAGQVADQIEENSLQQELTTSLPAEGSTKIYLDNAVGRVELFSGQGDDLNVSATIIAHNPLTVNTDRKIIENAEVSIEKEGSRLTVSTHSKENQEKDLWTWAQKKYGHSDFSINYVIEIPAGITAYDITSNVGSIELNGLEGSFDVTSDVGTITLKEAVITGKSKLQTDTGSIELGLEGMETGSSLKASSAIGAIKAHLASSLNCTVKASSELGGISGVADGKQDYNEGGPLLSLSTEIGAISVIQ